MPTVAHRFTAVLGIALVLALSVLAVWPEGHTRLHSGPNVGRCANGHTHDSVPTNDDDDRDDCVVIKFANGGAGLAVALEFFIAPLNVCVATLATAPAFDAASPAHLLPPGCGPPVV